MTNPLFLFQYSFVVGETFRLDGDEGRHAATVKRIRVGESVDITDGQGTRAVCTVIEVGKNYLELLVSGVTQEPALQPRLIAVQALAKGDRADLALEVLTEVGIDEIIPWSAAHSIVKWDDPTKAIKKWERTITEAAKQSRRAWIPKLHDVHSTAKVPELIESVDLALVLHESASQPLADIHVASAGSIALIIGPEGGISSEEIDMFTQAGAHLVRMGPTVMRTSTAGAIAAGVVLSQTNRWS